MYAAGFTEKLIVRAIEGFSRKELQLISGNVEALRAAFPNQEKVSNREPLL